MLLCALLIFHRKRNHLHNVIYKKFYRRESLFLFYFHGKYNTPCNRPLLLESPNFRKYIVALSKCDKLCRKTYSHTLFCIYSPIQEVKGDSSSGHVVTRKLNKLKNFVLTKKAKAIEATAGKILSSNGSVNGLNHVTSDAELQNKVGGET